jgi:trimeric autotransporter adhesin
MSQTVRKNATTLFAVVVLTAVIGGAWATPGLQAQTSGNLDFRYWKLTGNSGTNPSTNFLGTTDNQPLIVKVNGTRVYRLEPTNGTPNIVGGFSGNTVSPGVQGATIGGGGEGTIFGGPNEVTGNFGTVSGGFNNTASHLAATVGGGFDNTASERSTVSGGEANSAAGNSNVGGGFANRASGFGTTVGGGFQNIATDFYVTVAGGGANNASLEGATVGGGTGNTARGFNATVAGGTGNSASVFEATVGGGDSNTASSFDATVGGGNLNTASAPYSTVPGGRQNHAAGEYAFAAGRRAKANHSGSFVWGDSTNADVASTGANQFIVRSSGGATFYSNPSLTTGVTLPPGGGSWSSLSDAAVKENVTRVDSGQVLERVASLPLSTWNYKSQDPSIRHIGPMAQDFRAAFGVGEDDRYVASVDADGVALAAIQGLNEKVEALEERLAIETSTDQRSRAASIWQAAGMLVLALGIAVAGRRAGPLEGWPW